MQEPENWLHLREIKLHYDSYDETPDEDDILDFLPEGVKQCATWHMEGDKECTKMDITITINKEEMEEYFRDRYQSWFLKTMGLHTKK